MTTSTDPSRLTLAQLEAEARALIAHQERLRKLPTCDRPFCDGSPHPGAPGLHGATAFESPGPLHLAQELDPFYRRRSHLEYLNDRLVEAVVDVERGQDRRLIVSMPPRMGKSVMSSIYLPLWLLHRHPDWKIGLLSHSPDLAVSWARQVRRIVEEKGAQLGIDIAPDAGAVSNWETTRGGAVISKSVPGQSLTGLGFQVLLVDDPVKDYAAAHSEAARKHLWDWWQANTASRMEPPSMIVMIGTRWHESDLLGHLVNAEIGGEPDKWQIIKFPAIATEHDALGREPGEPLFSPILDETPEEAMARWESIRATVGSYNWAALYQQSPAPAEGAIFSIDDFRFWTRDPDKVKEGDSKVVFFDPDEHPEGDWLDSWDFTFGSKTSSADYVVGQRWVRVGPYRYLIAQQRGKMTFPESLAAMERWAITNDDAQSPFGRHVHKRLVEAAANGEAIIQSIRERLSGVKPISPRVSKESRARAITPEVESGHVLLPHPEDPGNEWVHDYLDELRAFPSGKNDDQVDATTQALLELRTPPPGLVTRPTDSARRLPGTLSGTARREVVPEKEPPRLPAGLAGASLTRNQPRRNRRLPGSLPRA